MLRAIIIDHYDSFTWNIKAWLVPRFNVEVISYLKIDDLQITDYDLIVLSPGPKTPDDYPSTLNLLNNLDPQQPVLGICLGMQTLIQKEGGSVEQYFPPLHGKTSSLVFNDIESKYNPIHDMVVARYHSLKCKPSSHFKVMAQTSDGVPMIAKHRFKKWLGIQFHPESFLTTKSSEFLSFVMNEVHL